MGNRRQFIQVAAASVAGVGLAERAHAAKPRYAIAPMAIPSLPVESSKERFPVHRIYCMGLNYAEHVKEGKGMLDVPPFYFQKSNDMIVENNSTIRYPLLTRNFHHEIELVVALAHGGTNIPVEKALDQVLFVLRPELAPGGDRGLELLLWLVFHPPRLSRTRPRHICSKQA